jgi:hypothetical protein
LRPTEILPVFDTIYSPFFIFIYVVEDICECGGGSTLAIYPFQTFPRENCDQYAIYECGGGYMLMWWRLYVNVVEAICE